MTSPNCALEVGGGAVAVAAEVVGADVAVAVVTEGRSAAAQVGSGAVLPAQVVARPLMGAGPCEALAGLACLACLVEGTVAVAVVVAGALAAAAAAVACLCLSADAAAVEAGQASEVAGGEGQQQHPKVVAGNFSAAETFQEAVNDAAAVAAAVAAVVAKVAAAGLHASPRVVAEGVVAVPRSLAFVVVAASSFAEGAVADPAPPVAACAAVAVAAWAVVAASCPALQDPEVEVAASAPDLGWAAVGGAGLSAGVLAKVLRQNHLSSEGVGAAPVGPVEGAEAGAALARRLSLALPVPSDSDRAS